MFAYGSMEYKMQYLCNRSKCELITELAVYLSEHKEDLRSKFIRDEFGLYDYMHTPRVNIDAWMISHEFIDEMRKKGYYHKTKPRIEVYTRINARKNLTSCWYPVGWKEYTHKEEKCDFELFHNRSACEVRFSERPENEILYLTGVGNMMMRKLNKRRDFADIYLLYILKKTLDEAISNMRQFFDVTVVTDLEVFEDGEEIWIQEVDVEERKEEKRKEEEEAKKKKEEDRIKLSLKHISFSVALDKIAKEESLEQLKIWYSSDKRGLVRQAILDRYKEIGSIPSIKKSESVKKAPSVKRGSYVPKMPVKATTQNLDDNSTEIIRGDYVYVGDSLEQSKVLDIQKNRIPQAKAKLEDLATPGWEVQVEAGHLKVWAYGKAVKKAMLC